MRRRYDSCLVICHGKSELIFVENLRSNLRLKFKIFAKDNGNSSIQITGLENVLRKPPFKSLKTFKDKYDLDIRNRQIKSFKVFIIMDFDEMEYTEEIKRNYLNKSMFKDHFLRDYIVPIYNIKNFDDIMIKAGYQINVKKKSSSYSKIFPGENGNIQEFLKVRDNISKVSSNYTNVIELINYLLDEYEKRTNKQI